MGSLNRSSPLLISLVFYELRRRGQEIKVQITGCFTVNKLLQVIVYSDIFIFFIALTVIYAKVYVFFQFNISVQVGIDCIEVILLVSYVHKQQIFSHMTCRSIPEIATKVCIIMHSVIQAFISRTKIIDLLVDLKLFFLFCCFVELLLCKQSKIKIQKVKFT